MKPTEKTFSPREQVCGFFGKQTKNKNKTQETNLGEPAERKLGERSSSCGKRSQSKEGFK